MDTKHNPFILGALVALSGVIIGAGSVSFVNTSNAFSGINPNFAKNNPRPFTAVERRHARDEEIERPPSILREMALRSQRRRAERLRGHTAAPRVREVEVRQNTGLPEELSHCEGLSRARLANCVGVYLKYGEIYQRTQTGY